MATNFDQKKWWEYVGSHPDIKGTKTHIWTPHKEGGAWQATPIYEPHLKILKENIKFDKVLDFGCGLGRNFPTLEALFEEIHGFDTCPMVDKLVSIHEEEGLGYELLTCDWDAHKDNVFDCVFECTVLQHIPTEEVKSRLKDISQMTEYLVGNFRSFNDQNRDFKQNFGGHNMMQLVEEVDAFDIVDCSIDPWSAATLMDVTHYNILLKSK